MWYSSANRTAKASGQEGQRCLRIIPVGLLSMLIRLPYDGSPSWRVVSGCWSDLVGHPPIVWVRNVQMRAFIRAACALSAAPPWPPSMFSQ